MPTMNNYSCAWLTSSMLNLLLHKRDFEFYSKVAEATIGIGVG